MGLTILFSYKLPPHEGLRDARVMGEGSGLASELTLP